MKTYELPEWAIVRWVSIDDIPRVLTFHRMDWAYWLLTMYNWTIVNIWAMQEREEKEWEYWIA